MKELTTREQMLEIINMYRKLQDRFILGEYNGYNFHIDFYYNSGASVTFFAKGRVLVCMDIYSFWEYEKNISNFEYFKRKLKHIYDIEL